ncbi:HK97 family phage prohead protease [Pseudophaeobacter flagellatus]|uniref:HK97 family phage prohead protease n=1 Tax=Pseudophaeobacter flagellatus TaxID=2899119 RepID=UPI001E3C7D60|nr:HK97 family phage prohead protease [Pseudophaeobacter flagellatus]MCD9146731.1 HK97 family phage prohead protease [Pseudophaeobacter flagellatus]
MESRATWVAQSLEVRQQGGRPTIVGRFPYQALAVIADRGTIRKERIMPGAFDFTLQDDTREVNLLVGHSFDKPLASKKAGSLEFNDTEEFLEFSAIIPEGAERASHVTDALAMLGAGLIKGVSPGFRVPPKDVVPDAEKLVPEPGNPGVMIRQLGALLLYELSLVTRPAYEASEAELRAMDRAQRHQPQPRIWLP